MATQEIDFDVLDLVSFKVTYLVLSSSDGLKVEIRTILFYVFDHSSTN